MQYKHIAGLGILTVGVIVCTVVYLGRTDSPLPVEQPREPVPATSGIGDAPRLDFPAAPSAGAKTADASGLAEAGIPALGRVWTADDYTRAEKVLSEGKVPLPLLSDDLGRQFLGRLTSPDNLSLYRSRAIPLQQRSEGSLQVGSALLAIAHQYRAAKKDGIDRQGEWIHLMAFHLRIEALEDQLEEESMAMIPPAAKTDSFYQSRLNELKEVRSKKSKVFAAFLETDPSASSESRSYVLQTLADTLPVAAHNLEPNDLMELRKRAEARRAENKQPNDTKNLQLILNALAAPAPHSAARLDVRPVSGAAR